MKIAKEKAVAVGIAVLVLAAAFGVKLMVQKSADSIEAQTENDSIFYFTKNTSLPDGLTVFADDGEETSEVTPAAWKVTSPEGNSIYMLGTMHMLPESAYPLPDYLKEAFDQADVLAVETNNVDTGVHFGEDVSYVREQECEDGKTLKDYLSDDVYTSLAEYLANKGEDIADYSQYQPWYVYKQITETSTQWGDFDVDYGLDRVLKISANIDDKEIYEVETYESKVNLERSYPDEVYNLLIKLSLLKSGEVDLELINEWYSAWSTADLEKVYNLEITYDESLTEEERSIMDEYYQIYVYDRNEVMVEQAEKLMQEGKNVLFTVGVAHYVGDEGIIALLEKDGYTCERIDN